MGVFMERREVPAWYHTHTGQDQGPVGRRHSTGRGGEGMSRSSARRKRVREESRLGTQERVM